MGTIEQELSDYIWNNLTQLKSIFSDKVYQILSKQKDKDEFRDTIEVIMDIDSDFFDKVNTEYMKNLSIDKVSKQLAIVPTDEVIERAEYWLENYKKEDEKHALLLNNLAFFYKSKNEYKKVETLSNKAIGIYQKVVELNPVDDDAYRNMGNAYSNKDEYDKAIESYQKAIEINPKNDNTYNGMGNSYYSKDEYDKAIKYYQKALEINSKNDNAYNGMGNSYYSKDKYDKAIKYYQKALEINSKNDKAYIGMGNSYYSKDEYDKAIKCYQKALEINSKNDKVYIGMGSSYYRKDEYDKSIEYYQKVLEINHKNDNAYNGMGNSYYSKDEYDKAIKCYQKALEINSKNDNAYVNMGNSYNNNNKYDKAIKCYQKALEINPKNDNAYNGMGISYYSKDEYDKAIEYYQKAIEINPKNNYVFNNLNNLMTNLNKAFFLDKKISNLNFKIESLRVQKFKQYKASFEIEFSKQVNIIVGKNAIGKTTLLQAITLGLLKKNSPDTPTSYEEYISKGENKSEITIYHNDKEERKIEILKDKREIKENYFIPFVLAYGSNFFTSKTNEVKEVAQSIVNHTIHKDFTTSIFMDYTSGFVNPIRLLEFLDLERDESVPSIQKTFITTINDFLEGFKLIATEDKNYFFQQDDCDDRLSLEELSEGYRGNVLLITDILIKVLGVGYMPDTIEGIILIDEFDKHLHPRWQSKLVSKLTEVFPHIQFIMTTHNPMSILDREADEITILKETKDGIKAIHKRVGTKKIGVSTILLEYFGVKSTVSKTMEDKIDAFTKLKLKDKLSSKEEKEMLKLEDFLDETVATNFIYNRAYFNFLKFLKENKDINFKDYEEMSNEKMELLLNEFKDLFE